MKISSDKIVEKPWGYEIIWAQTGTYVGKILRINAGKRLSRQYHQQKDETFRVLDGKLDLEIGITHITGDRPGVQVIRMNQGDTFHCLPGIIHRMCAVTDVTVLEVSTPELDDIVRLEDDYGR